MWWICQYQVYDVLSENVQRLRPFARDWLQLMFMYSYELIYCTGSQHHALQTSASCGVEKEPRWEGAGWFPLMPSTRYNIPGAAVPGLTPTWISFEKMVDIQQQTLRYSWDNSQNFPRLSSSTAEQNTHQRNTFCPHLAVFLPRGLQEVRQNICPQDSW